MNQIKYNIFLTEYLTNRNEIYIITTIFGVLCIRYEIIEDKFVILSAYSPFYDGDSTSQLYLISLVFKNIRELNSYLVIINKKTIDITSYL